MLALRRLASVGGVDFPVLLFVARFIVVRLFFRGTVVVFRVFIFVVVVVVVLV
jgi:hypothetical protein